MHSFSAAGIQVENSASSPLLNGQMMEILKIVSVKSDLCFAQWIICRAWFLF